MENKSSPFIERAFLLDFLNAVCYNLSVNENLF